MRNNETGEYELVVGNRQLLSGFFIVVLLCAAAFAMGYVVGENSHSAKPPETAQSGSTTKPIEAPPETAAPAPAAPANPPADAPPAAADSAPADRPPQPTTRPARDVEPEPKAPPPKPPATASSAAPAAAPGQYWQVTATTNRNSAETLAQTLKDKGFPATLSVGRDNLTHVLVGPYTDRASLGRAKTDLENSGFSQLVRK